MTKEMQLLDKLELSEENRAKLLALLEEGKKVRQGLVEKKRLVETLDAVDATEERPSSSTTCWKRRTSRSTCPTCST